MRTKAAGSAAPHIVTSKYLGLWVTQFVGLFIRATLHCYASNNIYFIQGFLDVDNTMLQEESLKDELAGTTAVAIILKENKLYCVCASVCNYKQQVCDM